MAAEESAGADVEVHATPIKAEQFLGGGFTGQGDRSEEGVLRTTVQEDGPNAVAQAKITEAMTTKHVDGWADELAVSKVKDGRYVVAG